MNKAPVPRFELGSFLTNTPPPRVTKAIKPAKSRPATAKDRVRAYLDKQLPGKWFSMRQVAAVVGLTVSRTNDAVCQLCNAGEARREKPPSGRRNAGQRYQSTTINP